MSFIAGLFGAGQNNFRANPNQNNINDIINSEAAGEESALGTSLGQQNANLANENNLQSMLLNQANGAGVNPAQNMLNQATSQNIKTAAGLAASTKGISPALAARDAANTAANLNQTAAGQAATMNANQRLGALGQLGGLQGQIGQQNIAQQGIETGAINAGRSLQSNNLNQANAINAGVSQQNANASAGAFGGAANAAGSVLGLFAEGGEVLDPNGPKSHFGRHIKKYADGGDVTGLVNAVHLFDSKSNNDNKNPFAVTEDQAAGYKAFGDKLFGRTAPTDTSNAIQGAQNMVNATPSISEPMFGGPSQVAPMSAAPQVGDSAFGSAPAAPSLGTFSLAMGGRVPAKVSPGEVYLNPTKVEKLSKMGDKKGVVALKEGEKIPGKAKVKGDSYKNDTVPRELEEGGIVLPRHVTQSKNPSLEAAKFVDAVMAKKRAKGLRR